MLTVVDHTSLQARVFHACQVVRLGEEEQHRRNNKVGYSQNGDSVPHEECAWLMPGRSQVTLTTGLRGQGDATGIVGGRAPRWVEGGIVVERLGEYVVPHAEPCSPRYKVRHSRRWQHGWRGYGDGSADQKRFVE